MFSCEERSFYFFGLCISKYTSFSTSGEWIDGEKKMEVRCKRNELKFTGIIVKYPNIKFEAKRDVPI